jgi:integrase/recombinase XerD
MKCGAPDYVALRVQPVLSSSLAFHYEPHKQFPYSRFAPPFSKKTKGEPIMFQRIFTRHCTIQHHQSGPLVELRQAWLENRAQRGLSQRSLRRIASHLFRACQLLNLASDSDVTGDQIQAAADRWVNRPRPHRNFKHGLAVRKLFVQDVTNWLTFAGLLHPPQPRHEYEGLVAEFADYQRRERGIAPTTLYRLLWLVNDFLSLLHKDHLSLKALTISQIDTVLTRKGRDQDYGRLALQSYTSALRHLLRYTEMRGLSPQGVADQILTPRIWKDESLPTAPAWDDLQRLLAQLDQNHPTAIRDRAIILLLAIYGMRRCEVQSLELEHLDWDRGMITIQRSKLGPRQEFPLAPTVGAAIIRYLKEVRPRVTWREVFLSFHPPYHPLSGSAIYHIVGPRLKALCPGLKHHGPHALRHACATHLLAQGSSLKEIGDYLGHRRPDSTRIYAKVDLSLLREVANLELGGVR